MNILVLGAHPDDPESGCGGLGLLAANQGHRVVFAYVSSGIPCNIVGGRDEIEMREEEARSACEVCGVDPYFVRCPCSDIPFDQSTVEKVSNLARVADADLILTHWPVDSHPDHQAVGALGTQVVVGNPEVALAYYEVYTGVQTIAFQPNVFVDIGEVAEQKKRAVECHASQNTGNWWIYHDLMERQRFMEAFGSMRAGMGRAEGYYLAVSNSESRELFSTRCWLGPSGARTLRKTKHERLSLYPYDSDGPPERLR